MRTVDIDKGKISHTVVSLNKDLSRGISAPNRLSELT